MKDLSFAKYFNQNKSLHNGLHKGEVSIHSIEMKRKRREVLVWDSFKKGTYVRALHGELK